MSYPQHERAIIATLAQQPRWIAQVATVLQPHHFSDLALGRVYECIIAHKAVSAATLQPLLDASTLNALGGVMGIAELLEGPTVSDPLAIADELLAAHRRRVAVQALEMASARIKRGDSVQEAIGQMLASVSEVAEASETDLSDVDALFSRYIERVATKRATGFKINVIDSAIGGLRDGRLHIVAAPPGGGKTTLMMQAALQAASNGRIALYVSSEMSEEELIAIAVSHYAMMPLSPIAVRQYLAQGGMPPAIQEALARLREMKGKLRIVCRAAPTLADIELFVQRHLPAGGLLLVDYLQIMGKPQNAQNREQEVNYNAMGLKSIAVKYNVAVLTAAQLNQEGAVRESTAPLHHADVMIRIDMDRDTSLQSADVHCQFHLLKNRGGATGVHGVYFARARARFHGMESESLT